MAQVIDELATLADYVLIDCPAGIEHGFRNAVAGARVLGFAQQRRRKQFGLARHGVAASCVGSKPPSGISRLPFALLQHAVRQLDNLLVQPREKGRATAHRHQCPDLGLLHGDEADVPVCRNIGRFPSDGCRLHYIAQNMGRVVRRARHDPHASPLGRSTPRCSNDFLA